MRARVRTSGDVCAARSRAASAIGAAELRAPSLPPSAILCARRVDVSVPIGAPHDAAGRRDFDRALRARLDDLARRAGRPSMDSGPWPDAVVFDDEAELLACLARDWAAGRAADRWWWRALLRDRITLDVVVRRWTDVPSLIAPAFERLAVWGEGTRFASLLEPGQVHRLARGVLEAHAGPPLADLLTDPARPIGNARGDPARSGGEIARIEEAIVTAARRYGVSEVFTPLRHDQRALLAIAAVARHEPQALQRIGFAEAFRSTLRATAGADARLPSRARLASMSVARGVQLADGERADATPGTTLSAQAVHPGAVSAAPADGRPAAPRDSMPPALSALDGGATADRPTPAAAIATRAARPSSEEAPFAAFVDTPLGGLFYLLNVLIALRLYGDFTMPRRRGLPVSPWDLLACIAESWLGEPLDRATAQLLARLAGRSADERPGGRAIRPERLERWLPRLVGRIERRVAAALGESAGAGLARRVLGHPARVHVTAAHVDVVFDLASLPIEIRLAGLDRNPGWVPAAGRIVALHYL